MAEAVQAAPREQGWVRLLLALAAFLFVPAVAVPAAMLPVTETFLLLVPAFAVCTLVGWWAGGRAVLPLIWVPLAAFTVWSGTAAMGSYGTLLRAWAVLLAGGFGVLALLDPQRPFFPRALSAVALTLVAALGLATMMRIPGGRLERLVSQQFERRNAQTTAQLRLVARQEPVLWQRFASRFGADASPIDDFERVLTVVSRATSRVFPALLALQSIAALALAWALYHRLGRARVGPPLAPMSEFRFNDQLVWGLIVGLTIILLPTLAPDRAAGFRSLRAPGLNLIVFFLSLYALRGFGVLSWLLSSRTLSIIVAVALVLVLLPVTTAVAMPGLLSLVTMAGVIGLGDTWFDWRRRARLTP